jgi:hypothetical protein
MRAGASRAPALRLDFRFKSVVGVRGFEPRASWSQTRRSDLTELHPVDSISVRSSRFCPCLLTSPDAECNQRLQGYSNENGDPRHHAVLPPARGVRELHRRRERWRPLEGRGVAALSAPSGVGLAVATWPEENSAAWLLLGGLKVALLLLALVVFGHASWRLWPARVLATRGEIPRFQLAFRPGWLGPQPSPCALVFTWFHVAFEVDRRTRALDSCRRQPRLTLR